MQRARRNATRAHCERCRAGAVDRRLEQRGKFSSRSGAAEGTSLTAMRAVLVVGLPRGGTTWVGRVFARAPETDYVHEPDGVHEPFAYRSRVRDGLENHAMLTPGQPAPEYERLWRCALGHERPSAPVRDRVARWAFGGVSSDRRLAERRAGRFSPRLRLAMATAVPRAARPDREIVVVKSVNAACASEWIFAKFEPMIVVVRRDVRSVVASWLSIGFGGPNPDFYAVVRRFAESRWSVDLDSIDDPFGSMVALIAVLTLALDDGLR